MNHQALTDTELADLVERCDGSFAAKQLKLSYEALRRDYVQLVRDRRRDLETIARHEAAMKPPGNLSEPRGAHAFEACKDGSLILYATLPDGDGEPIRIKPSRVMAVLYACADALARDPSVR